MSRYSTCPNTGPPRQSRASRCAHEMQSVRRQARRCPTELERIENDSRLDRETVAVTLRDDQPGTDIHPLRAACGPALLGRNDSRPIHFKIIDGAY
jgi:hypothetical protein